MANLEEIRASAERLVTAVSDALRLEIAIFDDSSNLFFCTPTYLKKKGRVVHAPLYGKSLKTAAFLSTSPVKCRPALAAVLKNTVHPR